MKKMSTIQENVEIKINIILDKIIDIILHKKYRKYFTYIIYNDLVSPIDLDLVGDFCYVNPPQDKK